ncbi:MAG: methionyl-tRNA formyltransferase [Firmicutes bacterium]|nr:methionyl-tRNA formyltransferase [Bacillota bacterium]
MRIVFCGTPEFAVPSLRTLLAAPDITVAAVVTQPDRPCGRGQSLKAPPVKQVALEAGVHVYQPETIKSESAQDFFRRLAPDAVVIIAYGKIIPASLLDIPPLGWINLHASLLPKYRGAAPIQWAIVRGETRTGLTTMKIDAGLDTGPILLQKEMAIGPDETAVELTARMAQEGAPLVLETLRKLAAGEIVPVEQDHEQATFAPLLKKEHGRILWSQPAQQVYNHMRGMQPWPGAFTRFRGQLCHLWGRPAQIERPVVALPGTLLPQGERLWVACGDATALELDTVHLEGRARVSAAEFLRGVRLRPGEAFES